MNIGSLDWDESLSVNNQVIDKQHQQLIHIINNFRKAYINNMHYEALNDILEQMTEYAIYHFQTEEQLMHDLNDRHVIAHIAEHESFILKVGEFRIDLLTNARSLPEKLIMFLQDWLVSHIKTTDKQSVKYF